MSVSSFLQIAFSPVSRIRRESNVAEIPDDPRTNFCVMILMHTKDAHLNLGNPGIVRDVIGAALDKVRGLQEEIDYTLDVYRTEGDKDVMTATVAALEAENTRLKAPVTKQDQKKFCSYVDLFDPTGDLCDGNWDAKNIMKMLASRASKEGRNA